MAKNRWGRAASSNGNGTTHFHADAPEPSRPLNAHVARIGTENVRSQVLAWPTCRFGSYNPYNLTYAATLVDGVPCVLGAGTRKVAVKGQ